MKDLSYFPFVDDILSFNNSPEKSEDMLQDLTEAINVQ